MRFSIHEAPPSLLDIENERQRLDRRLNSSVRWGNMVQYSSVGIPVLVYASIFATWYWGSLTAEYEDIAAVIIGSSFVAVLMYVLASSMAGKHAATSAVLLAGTAAAGGMVAAGSGKGIAAATVFIVVFLAGIGVAIRLGGLFIIQQEQVRSEMKELRELLYSKYPIECVAFVEWCKSDPVLAKHQHQLAELGRNPVMGEYRMAKNWIDTSEKRQSKEELMAKGKDR